MGFTVFFTSALSATFFEFTNTIAATRRCRVRPSARPSVRPHAHPSPQASGPVTEASASIAFASNILPMAVATTSAFSKAVVVATPRRWGRAQEVGGYGGSGGA